MRIISAAIAFAMGSSAMADPPEPVEPSSADSAADASIPGRADIPALAPVTVTVERRETQVQRTPATVSVLGAEALERGGVTKINDLYGYAPGVTVATRSHTPAIFIRGVGSTRPIGNQSVGIYLDDVYIARPFGAGLHGGLPDIDRVEILSGPQGTLYGKNTGAGAVKFITRKPSEHGSGWVSLSAGNRTTEGSGYVTGTVVPGLLSASLAAAYESIDPDTENVVLGRRTNGLESRKLRGVARFTPSESLEALLSLDWTTSETDFALSSVSHPDSAIRRSFSDIDSTQDYDGFGGSLVVEKRFNGSLRLKSVTAIREGEITMPTDSDGGPEYVNGFVQDLDMAQVSQEFQLFGDFERLSFVSGLIFFREDFDHYRWSWSSNNFSIIDSSVRSTTLGLYGQFDYRLTDTLTATAGLRVGRETSELDSAAYASNLAGDELAVRYAVAGLKQNYDVVQPKFSLSYQWTPELLAYATYSRGSTSGGYNSAASTLAVALTPVDPDRIAAYEVGLKTTGWNGRLTTSTSLFYNDYKDYQATVTNPVIDGQLITGAVFANAGRAHTYGAEFASTARLTRSLDATLALAYLETQFDEYLNPTGADATNYVGYDLPNSPRWSGSLQLQHRHELANAGEVRVWSALRYEDESYSSVSITRDMTRTPTQVYVDLAGSYTTSDGLWTFSVTAKNLFDRDFALPGSYTPSLGFHNVLYNRERQVAVGVRREFF